MKVFTASLAESSGLGYVRVCSCGSINLNIGAVTLHVEPDTFLRAAAMLQQAAVALTAMKRDATATLQTESDLLNPNTNQVN